MPRRTRAVAKARPRPSPLEFQVAREELGAAQVELELAALREELANLEESRQLFEELYDFAPVGYFSLDRRGCIHAINLTGAQLLSQRRTNLLGKPLLPLVSPPDRRKFLNHLTRLRRGQKQVTTELQVGLLETRIPVQLVSTQAGQTRRAPLYKTVIVDLSERKRNEEALRESESRFRLMADAAPVMIWISGLDKSCTYFNQGWLEFTGRTLDQEMGAGWAESIHPEDLKLCLATYESAFDARRPFQVEYRLRRYDGAYRWLLDHGVPRFLPDGEFLGYIGSCIDITERKLAEIGVHAAETQLRLITDISPVMITRCGRDLHYRFANRAYADFVGLPLEQIVGRPIREVLGQKAFEMILPRLQRVLDGDQVEYEAELPVAHARPRFLHIAYNPERDPAGNVVGWVAAITDITDRKLVERRIQVRDAVTRELAEANTLHEAAPRILELFCEMARWDAGALWLTDPKGLELWCVDFWHRLDAPVPRFEADTRTRRIGGGKASDVLEQAWRTGQPQVIPEIERAEDFLRKDTARRDGLRSGCCIAIKLGGKVLGVIECYSRVPSEPDAGLLKMLAAVSDKLGQFIQRKQTEEALRQSEARMRHILETALDAIITFDGDGVVTGWNPQAEASLGWSRPQAIGLKLTDAIISPRYRAAFEQGLRHYLDTGENPLQDKRIELTMLHRDGHEFPVELAITPLVLADHLAFSAFVRDISERKAAEEVLHRSHEELERLVSVRTGDLTKAMSDLKASETRFRGFVESAPDAVVITDEQGRIVLGNAQAERLFGYTRQELEGQPIEMLIPKRHRHAGPRAHSLAWSQARPTGSGLESFGLRKDGSEFPVEISLSPIQTPNGLLMCAALRDVTRRKQAEQALRESQERLTAIMEHTPALIFLKDIRGRYLHFNRQFAQTFKLGLQQVIGKTDEEIFPPAQATAFRANDSKVIKARAPIQFEEVAMHKDGLHTSLVTKFPLFNLQGKTYAVGGIVTDITERKRVEEALEQSREHYLALFKEARVAQEAARKFAGLVLHAQENERKRISRELHDDVGQALNVVSLSLSALKKKVDQGDSLKPGQIREIQEMLERTMGTVHCFARELRPSMLDELGLLPALRSHLKNLSERTGLNVLLRADPRAEELGVEEKLVLFRVAQESLNNVVKHARASRVQVALRRTAQGVLLSVSDNGKSFRTDANGVERGKRLGLLGMQERVRLVNGRFSILPQPGKGTRVQVMIPKNSSIHCSTPASLEPISPAP